MCKCTYVRTYIHTYINTYIHTYLHTYTHIHIFSSEKLKKALRDSYRELTMPLQETVHVDSVSEAALDDMFVKLRIQRSGPTNLPETPGDRDVAALQRLIETTDPIQLSQLFDKLCDRLAPRSVLLLGRAGVGKSTLMKQMAQLWAKGELWKDAVEYLFLITLRELQQDKKWTLEDLLLDGLPLTGPERRVAMCLLQEENSRILIAEDGFDELDHQIGKKSDVRPVDERTDLNTLLSSITRNTMLKGAKVIVTSRHNNNVPRCDRITELFGFPADSIQKYIEKFSREDTPLETYIKHQLQQNVNLATLCYLPVQCNFVCVCLSDMHSASHSENAATVATMTQLYVMAVINMARKHHPALKSSSTEIGSKTFYDMMGKSFRSHAALAKHFTVSTQLKIILYEEDLVQFDITEEDRRTGFLAQSHTKDRTKCFTRPCWSFHHLSIQEMFAAVGLLLGPRKELMKLVEDKDSTLRHEVLIKFLIGLWCDPQNTDFMESVSGQVFVQVSRHGIVRNWFKLCTSSEHNLPYITAG